MTKTAIHARDVDIAARLPALGSALRMLAESTGLRIAVLARVTSTHWTCCGIHDGAEFGMLAGAELDIATTY